MTTTSAAAASSTTIKLGDKDYTLSPLREMDYGEFELWVRARRVKIATDTLDSIPKEHQEAYLRTAQQDAAKLTLQSPECLSLMVSYEGMAHMLWLGLRQKHPDLEERDVRELLLDPKNLNDAAIQMSTVEGHIAFESTIKKKTASQKRKKKHRKKT